MSDKQNKPEMVVLLSGPREIWNPEIERRFCNQIKDPDLKYNRIEYPTKNPFSAGPVDLCHLRCRPEKQIVSRIITGLESVLEDEDKKFFWIRLPGCYSMPIF